MERPQQFDLLKHPLTDELAPLLNWPFHDRWPHNERGLRVETSVMDDLRQSQTPLIVTGFASLDHFIATARQLTHAEPLRILLGADKRPRRQRRPLFLKDIHDELKQKPLAFAEIRQAFATVPCGRALEERVSACILGVPKVS